MEKIFEMQLTNIFFNVSFYFLCSEIFFWSGVRGEWIEMPQFSDEKKIYRVPSDKQDQFYKFSQSNVENHFPHEHRNTFHNNDVKIEQILENGSAERVQVSESEPDDFADDPVVTIDEYSEEDVFSATTEGYEKTTDFQEEQVTDNKYINESTKVKDTVILDHLPVDVLEDVHRILKRQPASIEGKVQFLKTFERTLMAEIESRLTFTKITTSRKKRGAHDHYEHDHYDHYEHDEHSVGFPSIEGALMAISFLTFAVYLVRLVMLLFRNMNNAVQTTTAPTVFVGKRRRSINQLNDQTASILSSVDGFAYNF